MVLSGKQMEVIEGYRSIAYRIYRFYDSRNGIVHMGEVEQLASPVDRHLLSREDVSYEERGYTALVVVPATVHIGETEDGGVRVNMRSKCEVNVARIASSYGGGGHVLAAGCTVYEPMMLVKQHLLETIRRQMKEIGLESRSEGEA